MAPKKKFPAVFLDRDGTLNVEKDYLYRIEDFEFIDGSIEAVRMLNDHAFRVVVVTNQSGIARGFYTPSDVEALHRHIQAELNKHGAHIDAFFYCPHHPDAPVAAWRRECECRKPRTGMIREAEKTLDLDLERSYIVGDLTSDVLMGHAAKLKTILVRTGHGIEAADRLQEQGVPVDWVADDLRDAVRVILGHPAV